MSQQYLSNISAISQKHPWNWLRLMRALFAEYLLFACVFCKILYKK